jgi:nucleoside-diphosphate-sugar epimerase
MASVLITGGAGYIGSVLTAHLLGAGHRVRVLDKLIFGQSSLAPVSAHSSFELLEGDVRDLPTVQRAVKGVDVIVHLAAIVGDPACRAVPDIAREVNGDGAELLLETALRNQVGRFIFASTCSNYGRMADPSTYVTEESELRPVSLYAELKVAFEKTLLAANREGFVPIVLRFATAFGISPRPRFDLVVNEFTRDLYEQRHLEVFGETFWRPYCHIADISEAVRLAIEADKKKVRGNAFNVGKTTENYRKKDIVKLILERLPDRATFVSYVKKDEDPRDYRVSFEKINETLGLEPTVTVGRGIEQIISALEGKVVGDTTNGMYRNDNAAVYDVLRKVSR